MSLFYFKGFRVKSLTTLVEMGTNMVSLLDLPSRSAMGSEGTTHDAISAIL